ncbi:MAG: hypothetical protein ACFE8L_07135 [Candidatus Hodarchaeota archaeon]
MPQIVKGGKYLFGWSKLGNDGRIKIPPEAFEEYNLKQEKNCILFSGSKISGGFGLSSVHILKNSIMNEVLKKNPLLTNYEIPEGTIIEFNNKKYCWIAIHDDNYIYLPQETLKAFEIENSILLLSGRGSHLAIGFIAKGPIYNEAKNHPEIEIFE